jgi:hypothetical protein
MLAASKSLLAANQVSVCFPFSNRSLKLGRLAALCGLLWGSLFSAFGLSQEAKGPRLAVQSLPLTFEENRGQANTEYRYLFHRDGVKAMFLRGGVDFRLAGLKGSGGTVRLNLIGTNTAPEGTNLLEGRSNYLIGSDSSRWIRGVPHYGEVEYSAIYPGISLAFYGNGDALEHDFLVAPGADPSRIAFRLSGAKRVSVVAKGDLRISLTDGEISFKQPVAYQTVAGVRRSVDAAFVLGRDGAVHFRLGRYDRSEKLVIDPVLTFASYLSPLASDANLVATDASGSTYISGYAALGFPVTSSAFAGCANCIADTTVTFISKLSADGTTLIYSTVLGGNSFAQPTGIAVDGNGNVLVSGWTGASDFPTKNGQPIAPPDNAYLGFLVSLSADGSSLNYGTMLGSPPSVSPAAMTYASALAIDSSGNAYVAGETGDGFFTTPGALNQAAVTNSRNSFDIYLAKFSPTGTLVYSAVLGTADPQNGGGGPIGASAIAVDAAGDAFVAGQAGTLWPITSNAYLKQIAGSMPYATPFVTEVSPDATSLAYSTYLDYAYTVNGIAVLPSGNVFVTVNGAGASYPTTPNAYEQNSGGGAFLTELNSDGSALAYSTLVGGGSLTIDGLALSPDGDIWLAGQTSNPQFPLVVPIQGIFPTTNGLAPASVVNQFDPTGQTLKFSTFLGGSAPGYASSIAVDGNQRVHVSGASEYGMYTTPGVYAGSIPAPGPGYSEATYAYVALIDPNIAGATLCLGNSASAGLSFGYLLPQTTQTQSVQVSNCGGAPLTFSSIASNNAAFIVPAGSDGCTGSIAVGSSCAVSVQFAPAAVQTYTGQLTFTSNASISTTSIPLSGVGAEPVASISSAVTFQPALVGKTSTSYYAALNNSGPVPLTINLAKVTITGDFALATGGSCTTTLAPSSTCLFFITFTPTAAGTRSGTLSVPTSDPVNPIVNSSLSGTGFVTYPIPTITAVVNPSYPINSGTTPVAASIVGTNFFPSSVVYVNGVAQPTRYQDSTYMNFTLDPTLLNAVGTIPVTVGNPTPGGGASAPYPMIAYLSIPLTASALTVDPVGGLLYAAIPASATLNPSTIIPINPATGALNSPIAVSSDPQRLAISDDGSELYVATSAGVLQRINLSTMAIERTFNLPVDPEFGQTYVQEMHVVPGSPQSIVVELFDIADPPEDGAALYNDSGLVNWIPGQRSVNSANTLFWMDSFAFTSPSLIYGLPGTLNSSFIEVQVSPNGLSAGNAPPGEISEGTGDIVRSDGTLLYTNSGEVLNPATQQLLGTYLEPSGSQLFDAASVVPDTANGHTYFLDTDSEYYEYESLNIDVYDQTSYAQLGVVPFLNIYSPDATDLVRWGSNGFAFRGIDATGTQPSQNQIVIVTSNLVPSSNSSPVPVLSSVSPSTTYVGGPAYTMQLTGSGFTWASTVQINGNSRATAYVSSKSLTVQVLASDISAAGQLQVQVTTPAPGGGTSNSLTVSIELATPTITWANPTAITYGTALSATQLNATASIPGTFVYTPATGTVLAVGSRTLSVTFTPTDTSDYTTATDTVQLIVNKAVPTVTATPSASSITTAQPLSVAVQVSDGSGNPTPTGTVSLAGGGYTSGPVALSSGGATISIPTNSLTVGSDTLTISYTPDSSSSSTYNGSSGTVSVAVTAPPEIASTVTVAPSLTTITNEQIDAVSITVNGSGAAPPSGTVTLSNGSYSAQQTLSSGAAMFNIPAGALSIGTDTLTATYAGDATYIGSTGTAVVTVSQVMITAPTPPSVPPGSSASSIMTLSASSTYSGTMDMTCTLAASPAGAQSVPVCSLNPPTVTLAAGGSGTSELIVRTTPTIVSGLARPSGQNLWRLGGGGAVLAAVLMFGIPTRRRRWLSMLALLVAVAAVGVIGCGGSQSFTPPANNPGTTAGSYTFTVTGTDSANSTITASTTVTITVQ